MKTQTGYKDLTKLPKDENFVAIIEFKGKIIVCSTKRIYELTEGKLCPIKIKMEKQAEELFYEGKSVYISGLKNLPKINNKTYRVKKN